MTEHTHTEPEADEDKDWYSIVYQITDREREILRQHFSPGEPPVHTNIRMAMYVDGLTATVARPRPDQVIDALLARLYLALAGNDA